MDKKQFYKEQAEKFRDYASKFPDRDLLSLFEEWYESKDFNDKDREGIFARFLSQLAMKNQIFIPRLKVNLRDDPIALKDIVDFVLLAIRLADEEEKNNLDSK